MCRGEGVLRWRQPCPDGVLRDLEHPCPNGCGPGWRHPAGAKDQVIDPDAAENGLPGSPVRRRGRADQANELGGEFVSGTLETWGFKD
jgi:hypothetical protein